MFHGRVDGDHAAAVFEDIGIAARLQEHHAVGNAEAVRQTLNFLFAVDDVVVARMVLDHQHGIARGMTRKGSENLRCRFAGEENSESTVS